MFTFSGEKIRKSTKIFTLVFTLVECNPYRYKVFMYEQDTDKGEVGGSSPPRPTILKVFRGLSVPRKCEHLWTHDLVLTVNVSLVQKPMASFKNEIYYKTKMVF